MAISFERTAHGGGKPIFWRGECKVLPGGFKLLNPPAVGTVIDKGSLLYLDFEKMGAYLYRYAKSMEEGIAQAHKVYKGHFLKTGEAIAAGEGEDIEILAIDESNPNYDIILLSKAFNFTVNDNVIEALEDNNPHRCNAVVAAELVYDGKGLPTIDAAYDAVIIKKNLTNPVPDFALSNERFFLEGNPNIIYINQ